MQVGYQLRATSLLLNLVRLASQFINLSVVIVSLMRHLVVFLLEAVDGSLTSDALFL
jgi:hypothetical protein